MIDRTPRHLFRDVLLILALSAAFLTGCSAVPEYGGLFRFVSPGGKAEFSYPPAERGRIADLGGPDLMADRTIRMSDYAGEVVVLNVWGSWCGPCRAEAETLNVAAELTRDLGVQFLGINVQDSRESAQDFQLAQGVPYPSIFDPTMRTLLALEGFPTSAIPATIIVDRERRVAQIYLRVVTAAELVDAVTKVAAEPPASTKSAAA